MALLRRLRQAAIVATVSVCALAVPAQAQLVRGTVRDSASQQAIPGAVLVMLDSAGRPLGRNITNAHGQYTIAITNAVQRIRFLRIGFRPRVIPAPPSSTQGATVDVAMARIPTLLAAVSVMDQPNCPRRTDRPAAFSLWEQAKAALLASVVAKDVNPPYITRLSLERRLDGRDRVISQKIHIDSAATSRPFIATRSAAEFVEGGFAYDSAEKQWFNGPDAEVMLDDAFARGYCFQLAEADRDRPSEVGLAFAAAKHKRNRIDIEGTVWIDTASRSLTDVVFRFVGVDRQAARLHPGGSVSFHTMENGVVLIDRWALRLGHPAMVSNLPALEPHETGGEVAYARWSDGREWHASLGRVRGRIVGAHVAHMAVRLLNTDYAAVTDSTGAFEISNLLPGPYAVAAADGRLADLGIVLKTPVSFTAVRDSTVDIAFGVPSVEAYVAATCTATADTTANALLVARVMMPDGSMAAGAQVEIRAADDGNLRRVASGKADENGLFQLCHAPRNTRLQIRADHAGAVSAVGFLDMTESFATLRVKLGAERK